MCRWLLLVALIVVPIAGVAHTTGAAIGAERLTVNCSALTLPLHPGYNPPPPGPQPTPVVPSDAPRGDYSVSLPLYPGVRPLQPFVGTPFPNYQTNPYLQTASAEYLASHSPAEVERWAVGVFPSCGWVSGGSWSRITGTFRHGLGFVARANDRLSIEVSFGSAPSGGTYVAYGVEEEIYPPRPAHSYLHGPFVRVRIAVAQNTMRPSKPAGPTIHVLVRNRTAIRQLVAAVNSVRDYRASYKITCPGPGSGPSGPAWLTFTRSNSTASHAFEAGPGVCGGLAVNGVRWLIDHGRVWNLILSLTKGRG